MARWVQSSSIVIQGVGGCMAAGGRRSWGSGGGYPGALAESGGDLVGWAQSVRWTDDSGGEPSKFR